MHSKSDNIEIMISDVTDEIIEKLFNSLKNRYQNNLQSIKGSECVFDYVQLLYYKCHKINVNGDESYIDSPDWIKNKKATISPINKKDNKCFQYAVTVALNYEEIKKDPQITSKIKPFINRYYWEGIHYPSEKDHWTNFEKNIVTIAHNIMFCMLKKKKHILLMFQNLTQIVKNKFSNREKGRWHYLAVKKLSALLRGVTSKHYGDFYCLNCFNSFGTKNKLQSHKRVCENKDFCNIIMPSEDTKILQFNQYQKSDKAPFIIYADVECIIEKIDGCKNNPENSSTTKVSEHI